MASNEEAAAEYYEGNKVYERIMREHADCKCHSCTHIDDPELDLESRLDMVEIGLMTIRTALANLSNKIDLLSIQNGKR